MKKVILMVDTSRAASRQILRGIENYIHTHRAWEVYVQPPNYLSRHSMNIDKWIQIHKFDGIIIRDVPYTQNIMSLGIPKIISDTTNENFPEITTITSDCYSISKTAADYFIGLGFINFAFCGFSNLPWSEERLKHYKEILASCKNFRFFYYNSQYYMGDILKEKRKISAWLKALPKPLCVFTCNDDRGLYLLEVCKIEGLIVPEEIAILGVDNDELVCNLSYPPLSSIKVGFEKAGFEAAQALDKQMKGEKSIVNIKARAQRVIQRQSSDIIAVEDLDITRALIFIRENLNKPIQVTDVVSATNLSRRVLEMRFKQSLKRSINYEISRQRIDNIKLKLINSHIPIYRIAKSFGYRHSGHFSRYFKKVTSMSPLEYRRYYRNIS